MEGQGLFQCKTFGSHRAIRIFSIANPNLGFTVFGFSWYRWNLYQLIKRQPYVLFHISCIILSYIKNFILNYIKNRIFNSELFLLLLPSVFTFLMVYFGSGVQTY